MSTILGFNCLRSSPSLSGSLAGAARLLQRPQCPQSRVASAWRLFSQTHVPNKKTRQQWPSSPSQLLFLNSHQRRTLFGGRSSQIIVDYIYLPPTYTDEEGLPFLPDDKPLTGEAVRAIFPKSPKMNPERATKLLKILHGRRVAGTLNDPSLFANTRKYSDHEITCAISYLRREIPVDEIANAGLHAEDELNELEAQANAATTSNDGKEQQQSSVYGQGVIDKIRAKNIALREAEERAAAERKQAEEAAAAEKWAAMSPVPYDPAVHRGLHPSQLEHYEAAISPLTAPPQLPRWRLLLPSTAFVAAIMAALYFLVDPKPILPPQEDDDAAGLSVASRAVMWGLALVNISVFIAWRRVRLWKYLNKHFLLDFSVPRPYQMLTALVSHQQPKHLVKTLFVGLVGAALLVDEFGPAGFLATYVSAGLGGFLASLWTRVVSGNVAVYMFGASSASLGSVCAYFWLYRFDGFKILGLPPDPLQGIQGLGIIGLLLSFYALIPMARRQVGSDWTSHLVGMLTGIACSAVLEGRWKAAKKEMAMKQFDVVVEEEEKPAQQSQKKK